MRHYLTPKKAAQYMTRKPTKPEISYCHKTGSFLRDNKPISFEQALEHWLAIDADWTMGAYAKMRELS